MDDLNFQQNFVCSVIQQSLQPFHSIEDSIIPIGKLSKHQVHRIYCEDYQYRMLEAMQSLYESVWMILGDDSFKTLVFDYIKIFPSKEYNLNLYGQDFPTYLSQQQEVLEQLPFIVDLANFEVLFWKCFHSNTPPGGHINANDASSILRAKLEFSDALQLHSFAFDIFPLFDLRHLDSHSDQIQKTIKNMNPNAYYLIFKSNDLQTVNCHSISYAQFLVFQRLIENTSVLEVIEKLEDNTFIELTSKDVSDIFHFISHHLQHFLI